MLETIAVLMIILWLVGMIGSYTMGGFLHALLVVGVMLFVARVAAGRKPV